MPFQYFIQIFNNEGQLIEEFKPREEEDQPASNTNPCTDVLLDVLNITNLHALRVEFTIKIVPDSPYDEQIISDKIQKIKSKASPFDTYYLTRREREVLLHILNGLTTKAIADRLFISFETARTHRKNILSKTGVNNTSSLNKLFNPFIKSTISSNH